MKSRNGLNINHLMKSEYDHVDTLYEIADAEFNSDKHVHALWNELASKHKEFRGLFARDLRWKLQAISKRENMYASMHMCDVVASQIANDWWIERQPKEAV